MAMPGFFGKVVPTKVRGIFAAQGALKPTLVDVGDKKDGGFQAASAAIISNVLTKPKINSDLLIQLLGHHARYVALPIETGHLTPTQRFEKMLVKPEILAQFTRDLAYTLRQLAVDEMCKFPKKYLLAFIGSNAPTSLTEMREPGAWIHPVAMDALANVLKLPITVNEIKPGKELQKQHHYGPDKKHSFCDEIVLQKERNHYVPQIIQVERFKSASAHVTHPVKVLPHTPAIDVNLEIILESVKQESHELICVFEQHVRRLRTMVQAGEVNKKSLLAVHTQNSAKNDSQNGVKKAGLELGSQRFFEELVYFNKPTTSLSDLSGNDCHDGRVINALVDGFARDIAIGRRDENSLFAQLESLENHQTASKTMSF
jgi:hypothetical protein